MKILRQKRGFTFVDTAIAITLISVGLFAILSIVYSSAGNSLDSHLTIMATTLAREKLEKMVFDKKMNGWASIDTVNYPATETFTGAYAPFTRTVAIIKVDRDDLITERVNTNYKRITVTVSWNSGGAKSVTLETVVSLWGEG